MTLPITGWRRTCHLRHQQDRHAEFNRDDEIHPDHAGEISIGKDIASCEQHRFSCCYEHGDKAQHGEDSKVAPRLLFPAQALHALLVDDRAIFVVSSRASSRETVREMCLSLDIVTGEVTEKKR